MKTLLVDNYDSYTYNLFQLIAAVAGREPVVLRNDAPECVDLELSSFDNVVISPGPGHPGRSADFGACARILTDSTIPVLGVCLGHQGIAVGEDAEVGPAPTPRHGHLSTIRHDGRELFHGIPQGFGAVRYHSLCVRPPLPPTLEATAWAEDGVIMALRHRERPIWGVQFHPESILTEYGHQLIANFGALTRRRRTAGRRVAAVTSEAGRTFPAPRPGRYRLHTRTMRTPVDAESVFLALFADSPRAFWLDSAQVVPGQGRFSFLGDDSGPLAEFVRYDVRTATVEIDRAGRPTELVAGGVFDYLKRELDRRRIVPPSLPFDFTGGYVGYFGYEMKADCGATNRHRSPVPDASWLFADRLIVVDHQEGDTYLVCLAEDTPAGRAEAARWLDMTGDRIAGLVTDVSAPDERETDEPAGDAAVAPSPGADAGPEAVEPWLTRDRRRYLADIEACQRALRAGESYEICLTNAVRLPAPGDPFAFYRRLRRYNPAPYSAFLRFGDVEVASSSPERFLRITPDRVVETKPIKGTAPRGLGPEEDERLRAELAHSPKTRAENLMIVDLLRNDLGRVCEVGSVRVPRLMAIETYQTVHQLVSTIRGQLRPDADAIDCVRACFPGGSMTGAPKIRTMEIIDRLETAARGVYSGTIGYLSCAGTADLGIVIRTAVFTRGRADGGPTSRSGRTRPSADRQVEIGAGGAIVLDSDPTDEYAEMLLKLAAPMRAYRDWARSAGSAATPPVPSPPPRSVLPELNLKRTEAPR